MNEKTKKDYFKVISNNRRAKFDYQILETFEAGIALLGSEVKSLRLGRSSIAEAYIGRINNKYELELVNSSISSYKNAAHFDHDEKRNRKLLLHKKEIIKIINSITKKGYTSIPLRLYFKGGLVKIEICLAKGKDNFDKRNSIKEKDWKREQSKIIKQYNIKS